MLKITFEYIPFSDNVSFLMIKQTEVTQRKEYLCFFYAHVYTSIFVLLVGFLAILRENFGWSNFHKLSGKVYVFLILFFASPSGIYMGFLANGNFYAKLSFVLLGIFWWFSTFKAFNLAINKKFYEHKKWMWRSFALTLSAITLRMWKVIIVYLFQPNPMDVYQIIAWLGWVPNILLVEFLIRNRSI
ncbi:MAG: hypothetical protein C4K58_07290 [Flavobacteriaceae bacterium]|nr:MAG: hypothetical protein C4K58_07290 [Flavobacteriaceae bacterium]